MRINHLANSISSSHIQYVTAWMTYVGICIYVHSSSRSPHFTSTKNVRNFIFSIDHVKFRPLILSIGHIIKSRHIVSEPCAKWKGITGRIIKSLTSDNGKCNKDHPKRIAFLVVGLLAISSIPNIPFVKLDGWSDWLAPSCNIYSFYPG